MILIIQTVRPEIELMILDEKMQLVAGRNWLSAKDEVARILPEIEKLMEDTSVTWKDMKKIVVFNGIGGFSSTRIGVTISNTLSMVSGAELYEMSWPEGGEDTAMLVKDFLNGRVDGKQAAVRVKIAIPQYKSEPMISESKAKKFT